MIAMDLDDMAHREAVKRGYIGARVKCNTCGETIWSTHVHDMHSCSCDQNGDTAVWVDGGGSYLRLMWGDDASFRVIDDVGDDDA